MFLPRSRGHFSAHAEVVKNLVTCSIKESRVAKALALVRSRRILFLDGSGFHQLFIPISVLRGLYGSKDVYLLVRADFLDGGRVWWRMKRAMFTMLKKMNLVTIVAFRDCRSTKLLKTVSHYQIEDIQCWDLKYLSFELQKPFELADVDLSSELTFLIPATTGSNERRALDELLEYCGRIGSDIVVIVVGDTVAARRIASACARAVVIPRYVTQGEFVYLIRKTSLVFSFLEKGNCRPSGVFGRAMQTGTQVVVRKDGYLDRAYAYGGKVAVQSLGEIDWKPVEFGSASSLEAGADSAETLMEVLSQQGPSGSSAEDVCVVT